MATLRKLNENGLNRFRAFIDSLRGGQVVATPIEFLDDPSTSDALEVDASVEPLTFASRFEAARYIDERLSAGGVSGVELDAGLWAWLALYYFEQLCPSGRGGVRKPGEVNRWVPSASSWKYYRHLLAGPWRIFRAYRDQPERAMILLCSPLDKPGDFVEQLASRQDVVTNKAIIGAATALYFDPVARRPKRGAGANQHKPGTLRRLVDVVQQFDLTWDLYSLDATEFLTMLPAEFDRYKPNPN